MKRKLKFHLTSYQHMRELSVMTLFANVLIFALCFADTNARVRLHYSEVEKLGNSCPRMDSCSHQRSSGSRELFSIRERNCACDYLCSQYGDCCIDAPNNTMDGFSNGLSCYELKQFGGVYMKDSCLPSYNGPENVRYLCERTEPEDLSDPLGSLPVTHISTGLTYKNYYCSICNENSDDIVLWAPRLECPTLTLFNSSQNLTDEFVFENLASHGGSWGLYLDSENGSLFFHDCDIDPVMPPLLETKIRLCKPNLVSDCASNWKDEYTRTMCRSYMGAKFDHGGDGFKNVHCAICNRVNVSHLSCQSAEMRGINFFRQFESHAFSLLLDINEKMGAEVGLMKVCHGGEVYDPFFKKCRSLICLPGYTRQNGKCVLQNIPTTQAVTEGPIISLKPDILRNYDKQNVSYELELGNIAEPFPEDRNLDSDILSGVSINASTLDNEDSSQEEIGKFHNCLLISLTNEDYVILPNQSLYVPRYDKMYEPTSYHATDGSVLVCTPFVTESDHKFVPIMGYVTVTGLGISMFCLLLHFAAFCFVPDLQNLSGKNLASQCVSLFCAYFFFILGQFDVLGFTSCTAVAFLTFYFFQVSFFWMGVMSFDVWRTLKMATTELRVSSGRQMRRFGIYSFFTWMTPLFMVVILAFAEYTDLFPMPYRPGFARPRCWFKRRRALLVFFAMPLMAIMLANILLFVSSARMIVLTAQTGVKHQSQSQRRNFKLYLRLALLMGLTWLVGVIAGYADVHALWYLFIVLNTLQGLFIFVAFSCSTKVLNYVQSKFRSSRRQELSSKSASTGSRSF